MAREYTNKILNAVEAGEFNLELLIQDCLMWMSEHEVKEMCKHNDYFAYEEETEDELGA